MPITAAKFAEATSASMTVSQCAPEVSKDGRQRTQWWECCIVIEDRRETFRYGMGDGHRIENGPWRPLDQGGAKSRTPQRYTGATPARYNPDGSGKLWPRGTVVSDSDRYERSRPTPPELGEVLECLASDARCVSEDYGHTDMGEWADEFGYTDVGEAWRTWTALQDNVRKLRALLGAEFARFIEIEEDC